MLYLTQQVLRRAGGELSELKLRVLFILSHCLSGSQHSGLIDTRWVPEFQQSHADSTAISRKTRNFFLCVFCSESKHSEGRNDRKYAPSPFLMGGWFQSLAKENWITKTNLGTSEETGYRNKSTSFLRINPAGTISGCYVTEKQKFFLALLRYN